MNPGVLLNDDSQLGGTCNFCDLENTSQYLQSINVVFSNRWRDFGLMWVYILVNTLGAILLYKLFRVPRSKRASKGK